jgi:hypothetical protein
LLHRYDRLLADGYLANPPPAPKPERQPGLKRKPGPLKQNPARNLLDHLAREQVGGAPVSA